MVGAGVCIRATGQRFRVDAPPSHQRHSSPPDYRRFLMLMQPSPMAETSRSPSLRFCITQFIVLPLGEAVVEFAGNLRASQSASHPWEAV